MCGPLRLKNNIYEEQERKHKEKVDFQMLYSFYIHTKKTFVNVITAGCWMILMACYKTF